jgi:hypothetical protein
VRDLVWRHSHSAIGILPVGTLPDESTLILLDPYNADDARGPERWRHVTILRLQSDEAACPNIATSQAIDSTTTSQRPP